MSELITIARPYARAAFEHSRKFQKINVWLDMLNVITLILQDNKVKKIIELPTLSNKNKLALLLELYTRASNHPEVDFINFIEILAESKRLILLPQIKKLFSQYLFELEDKITATVTSAFVLDDLQKKKLTKVLQKRFGQNIDLIVVVDSNLIGGLIINVNNLIIDGSIRGRLTKLAESLNFIN